MSRSVLLVEPTRLDRSAIGSWLEEEGFEVLDCPGPSAPGYTCIGSTGATCPLAEAADVVVLDLRLASDDALQGTPGWELMLYYVQRGLHVIALAGSEDPVRPRSDDDVTVLDRPVRREALVEAVRSLPAAEEGRTWPRSS